MKRHSSLRGVKRAEKKEKQKNAPTGAGFSAQAKRSAVNKGYVGVPRALKPRARPSK